MDAFTKSEKLEEKLSNFFYEIDSSSKISPSRIKSIEKSLVQYIELSSDEVGYQVTSYINEFCENVSKGRSKNIENAIINSKNAFLAIDYVEDIIESRWEEAEHLFEGEIALSIRYGIKTKNFEIAEKNIREIIFEFNENDKKDIRNDKEKISKICSYIVDLCESKDERIPEFEFFILKDPKHIVEYSIKVLQNRWEEAEEAILKSKKAAKNYVNFFRFKWPDYEKKINKSSKDIMNYCEIVLKGKLPEELHNRMIMFSMNNKNPYAEEYFRYIKKREKSSLSYLKTLSKEEIEELIKKI